MIANVLAVVLGIVNLILRINGGADIIASIGVIISGVVVLMLLFSGWKGGELVFRHRVGVADRSEEHTSDLQSLMHISYAVFRLKKKQQSSNLPSEPNAL